jgi:acyl-coenzyme A thioesterase PaaI-like protein
MRWDPAASIPGRMGVKGELDESSSTLVLRLAPFAHLSTHASLRISVLCLMADMGGGFAAQMHSEGDWTFTTDMSVRMPVPRVPAEIVAHSRTLRAGRGLLQADVTMLDEHGDLFAYSQLGFSRTPRRESDPVKPEIVQSAKSWGSRPPIQEPLADACGMHVIDPSVGLVRCDLHDVLRNPAGAMQGAMVALLAELSAQALAEHHRGGPRVLTDIDVRYLRMGKTGPIEARSQFIGPPERGSLRTELIDRGEGDRLITAVLSRVAPA